MKRMKLIIIISLIFTIINLILIVIILFQMTKITKSNTFAEVPILEEDNNFENSFTIDIPKKDNSGEDAPPLLVVSDDQQIYVVGVFDGMGGSGSALYEENGETHTGAYLASRVVKRTTEHFFEEQINNENFEVDSIFINALKEKIVENLKDKLNKQNYEKSNIKSSLVRTFPTTMAIGQVSQHNDTLKMKVLWVGDSRVYFLSADEGLIQLTKDDLKLENDPYQNIANDSLLSNMVYLDGDFIINFYEKEYKYTAPAIFFAATDGCFGYFPTPMHFENLLLQTLQNSNSMQEWKQKIIEILKSISGDDCSISLVCLANKTVDFSKFKEHYLKRYASFYFNFYKKIEEVEEHIAELIKNQATEELAELEQERKEVYERLWNEYKKTNYSLFYTPDQCEKEK